MRLSSRNPKVLWRSIAVATAVGAVCTLILVNRQDDGARLSIVNRYVQLTLRSNREVAGLEYAYFSLSNCTANPVSYIGDRNLEPVGSVIEQRFDSNTGRLMLTNHNLARIQRTRVATLPERASVDFMLSYPAGLTGAVLAVPYLPAKSRLARAAENLKLQVMRKQAKPTNQFDLIELKLPLPR